MNYRKVIEGQIEYLQKKQKALKGRMIKIDCSLQIVKTISELAVMASKLPTEKED